MYRKRTEEERRALVVKGWAFRALSPEREAEIRAYLDGGPVPEGYETLDATVEA